jgi:hypothetical protein
MFVKPSLSGRGGDALQRALHQLGLPRRNQRRLRVAEGRADAVSRDSAEVGSTEEAVLACDLSSLDHPGRVTIGRGGLRLKDWSDQFRAISDKNVQVFVKEGNYVFASSDNASRNVEAGTTLSPSA